MPDQPNIIVFFTDQQRWDASSLHGNPLDLMPNFERLAKGGTHIANSFTCQPVCGPARACLQTGMYATTTGAYRNDVVPPVGTKMLGHYFREAGYATGYLGKWHLANGPHGPVAPEQRGGYEEWLASNILEFTSDAYDCVMYDNDGKAVKLPGYRVDAITDAMIRFVDRHKAEPFFLFTSFLEPHHQNSRDDYPAPIGYAEKYAGRWTPPDLEKFPGNSAKHLGGYWGMIKRLDEALGRVADALESLGLTENTVILFTSDHGNHFRSRNREYKRSCHESSIRVPTMFCGGPFEGRGQVSQLVSLIDLPPTLLETAGIAVPKEMQGRSILPILADPEASWPDDVFVQISESEVGRAIRTTRWKYSVTAPNLDGHKVPASDRYVEAYLYDLQSDPYELKNLLGFTSHRAVADRLRDRLLQRMTEAGEGPATIDPAPAVDNVDL